MVSPKYVTSSFGSAKFFFFIYKDMFKSFNKSDFSFHFLYKFFLDFSNKVSNSYESETALFCAKRRQKAPQFFFPKSATNFGQRRHIWSWKWPAMPFLFQFYVTIFPRETKNWKIFQNIKFFKIFPLNKDKNFYFSTRPKEFLAPQGSQK